MGSQNKSLNDTRGIRKNGLIKIYWTQHLSCTNWLTLNSISQIIRHYFGTGKLCMWGIYRFKKYFAGFETSPTILSVRETLWISLRSRRLEVVGTRKNGRARRRHARGVNSLLACLPRARPFSLSLTTSKRLLRRLLMDDHTYHATTW